MEPNNETADKTTGAVLIDAPTPTPSTVGDAKTASKSPRGRSTLHGSSYHLHMAMVILLRAYGLHREGHLPYFKITLEDPNAGKFDDVVLNYSSRSTPKGVVYIQAKHKQIADGTNKIPLIKKNTLLTKWHSKQPYSVPMYFVSYLEEYTNASTGSHTYMVCTNASIHKELEPYLTIRTHNEQDLLSFCDVLGATCYSFGSETKFKALDDELRQASLEKLGQLIATHAKQSKTITTNNPIFTMYANLVASCVERCDSGTYRFRDEFWTGKDLTSAQEKLKQAFEQEYKKLLHGQAAESIRWEDVQIKIEDAFAHHLVKQSSDSETVDQLIGKFYREFMFVCGSNNESALEKKALDIMPNWVHDKTSTYNNLFILLFVAMKEERPDPISFEQLKQKLIETNPNVTFANSVRVTEEHLYKVCIDYSRITMRTERLEDSALYYFISEETNYDVFRFRCSTSIKLNSIIVSQTLALRNYRCLIVDTASDVLRDLMEYISAVGLSVRYIITILGQLERVKLKEVRSLAKSHQTKVIIVEEVAADISEDRLFIRDVMHDPANPFFKQYETLHLFGTSVALKLLVRDDDSLNMLCHMFEKMSAAERQQPESIHQQKFNQIRRWYIPRSIVPFAQAKARPKEWPEKLRFKNFDYPDQVPFDSFEFLSATAATFLQSIMSSKPETDALPDELKDIGKEKVHIFLDEAGCGKSTYFTWLAAALANDNPSRYVMRMNAANYSTDFKRLQDTDVGSLSDTEVVRILYRFLHLTLYVSDVYSRSVRETDQERQQADRTAQLLTVANGSIELDEQMAEKAQLTYDQLLEVRLFQQKFNEKQCVLLFDGFDEVAPYYNNFAATFLARLAQFAGVQNLFLSTRPYDFEVELETLFENGRMYKFQPFFQREILLFIHNFFNHALAEYRRCDELDRIKVLAILYLLVKDNEFTRIPLFMLMTLTSFLPTVVHCVSFAHRTFARAMFRGKRIDKLQMIEDYVDKKLIILNTNKTGTNDSVLDIPVQRIKMSQTDRIMKRMHVLLAMFALFDQSVRHVLLLSAEQKEATDFMREVAEGNEKTGIIIGVAEDVPRFTHRIFVEYFAACWMHEHRDRMSSGESFFRSESYWTVDLMEMRCFFDRMIMKESSGCELHVTVLNKWEYEVGEMLSNNASAAFVKDAVGRLPIHLIVTHMKFDVKRLLAYEPLVATINEKDELFHWTALDYALVDHYAPTIEALVAHGATVHEETIFQQIYSNKLDDLFMCATILERDLRSIEQVKSVADKIYARTAEYLLDERKLDIFTPHAELGFSTVVEFCLKKEIIPLLKLLVSQMHARKPITAQESDQLLQTAFAKKACEFIAYLICECRMSLPVISNVPELAAALDYCTLEHNVPLFKIIFRQLCFQLDFPLLEVNVDAQKSYKTPSLDQQLHPKRCCVLPTDVAEVTWPVYSNDDGVPDDCSFEMLLAKAINAGSLPIARYIVETTGITITNRLIVAILKLIATVRFIYHDSSMPAFQYLLDRTVNLDSIDSEGRNLLHFTAQHGFCFFMQHCLFAVGFDPMAINPTNGWNVLRYAYHCREYQFSVTLEYLKKYHIFTWFDVLENMLLSVMKDVDSDDGTINSTSIRRHSLLAIRVSFDEKTRDELLSAAEQKELLDFKQQTIEAHNEKAVTIVAIQENELKFTVPVFADYFGARWLYETRCTMSTVQLFHSRSYWSKPLGQMRELFDRMIVRESTDCDVHLAVLNRSEKQFRELLSAIPSVECIKDTVGRLPLHLAVSHCFETAINLLIDKMSPQLINSRDELVHWTALDYAFMMQDFTTVRKLTSSGATVNEGMLLQQLLSNDLKHLLINVRSYVTCLLSNENTRLTALKLQQSVVAHLLYKKHLDINCRQDELDSLSVVEFCTKHSMQDFLDCFTADTLV